MTVLQESLLHLASVSCIPATLPLPSSETGVWPVRGHLSKLDRKSSVSKPSITRVTRVCCGCFWPERYSCILFTDMELRVCKWGTTSLVTELEPQCLHVVFLRSGLLKSAHKGILALLQDKWFLVQVRLGIDKSLRSTAVPAYVSNLDCGFSQIKGGVTTRPYEELWSTVKQIALASVQHVPPQQCTFHFLDLPLHHTSSANDHRPVLINHNLEPMV